MIRERNYLLLTPGPLSTSGTVREAMLQDWCTWDKDYNEGVVSPIRKGLLALAGLDEREYTDVLLQGSGTYCVEATIGATVRPTDKLLILANGAYGERMARIADYYGIHYVLVSLRETELVTGEVAEDLAQYMVESEQIPAAVGLGVLVDTDRTIKAAGGFIVQLMPGAPEELITALEDNIFVMDQLTTVLAEDGVDEAVRQVLKGLEYETVMRVPVEYRCNCSRERVEQALRSVGREELEDMAASGEETEVSCQFCDRVYRFGPEELRALAK